MILTAMLRHHALPILILSCCNAVIAVIDGGISRVRLFTICPSLPEFLRRIPAINASGVNL
jgi:hypothetical protein